MGEPTAPPGTETAKITKKRLLHEEAADNWNAAHPESPVDSRRVRRAGVAGNLIPFTKETATIAAHRSNESQRRNNEMLEANRKARKELLRHLKAEAPLAEVAKLTAQGILARVYDGELPITGGNAAGLIRVAYDISRLEAGESTSITERKSRDDILDEIAKLHNQLASNDPDDPDN